MGIFRFRNSTIDVEVEADTPEEAFADFYRDYPSQKERQVQMWREGDPDHE